MEHAEQTKGRMPRFTSLEEEAAFWETHSTTEFEDDWEPVEVAVSPHLGQVLSVRFDVEAFRRLTTLAKRRGLGASTLARMWVLDALERAEADEAARQTAIRVSAD